MPKIKRKNFEIEFIKEGNNFRIRNWTLRDDEIGFEETEKSKCGLFVQRMIFSDVFEDFVEVMLDNGVSVEDIMDYVLEELDNIAYQLVGDMEFENEEQDELQDEFQDNGFDFEPNDVREFQLEGQKKLFKEKYLEKLKKIKESKGNPEKKYYLLRRVLREQKKDVRARLKIMPKALKTLVKEQRYKEIEISDEELKDKNSLVKLFFDKKVRIYPLSDLKIQNSDKVSKKQKELIQTLGSKKPETTSEPIYTQDEVDKQNQQLEDTQEKLQKGEIESDITGEKISKEGQNLIELNKILDIEKL